MNNESLEATRRMRQMAEESKTAGEQTLKMLDEQGEQLNRVERTEDQINSDLKKAEGELEGMEKCCGLFVCPWRRVRGPACLPRRLPRSRGALSPAPSASRRQPAPSGTQRTGRRDSRYAPPCDGSRRRRRGGIFVGSLNAEPGGSGAALGAVEANELRDSAKRRYGEKRADETEEQFVQRITNDAREDRIRTTCARWATS